LDVLVHRSFKANYAPAISSWLRSHPGKNLTVIDLPDIIKQTFILSVISSNISGFMTTRISEFSPDKFAHDDFASKFFRGTTSKHQPKGLAANQQE
jgi:hypothetical protein